ncbi:electron transport complex subunit RsxG [Marinimicrobium sp. C6131]|uniref:electron transport complex subunit RsxG n=1 Tax=Marinimicrobium sp. C6131 TaxID=3022676 RepID=UPI00223CFFBC|nr:electron transport complex subunit RsxG [Marinimicrobium sp. C6131]UZJ44741.1 electron transport complex subunit RsxG [Marinimicrobium sp. C6131]
MFGWSIGKNSLLLGAFALVTAGVLAGTYQATRDQIADAERQAAAAALLEIIPEDQHDNDLLTDTLAVPEEALDTLGLRQPEAIHLARQNGQVEAVIIPAVAPDGYSGNIRMIVGVHRDGRIAGVRVLTHNETPGLGDKVDLKKSDWILGFHGRSLGNPAAEDWRVKKDGGAFDQFTGATITPRAVVHQVRRVLEFVDQYHTVLFPDDVPEKAPETSENTGTTQ